AAVAVAQISVMMCGGVEASRKRTSPAAAAPRVCSVLESIGNHARAGGLHYRHGSLGDALAVDDVEARPDDDRRADDRVAIRNIAEDHEAEERRPQEAGVAERRHE